MKTKQESAASSLHRALEKVRDADMKLIVYSGSVFAVPNDVDPQSHDDAIEACRTLGIEVTPIGLEADGGAGN